MENVVRAHSKEAVFTAAFAHGDRDYRGVAYEHDGTWEVAILDEDGLARCSWPVEASLLQQDPSRVIPTIVEMMIGMVQQGIMPLEEAGDVRH